MWLGHRTPDRKNWKFKLWLVSLCNFLVHVQDTFYSHRGVTLTRSVAKCSRN